MVPHLPWYQSMISTLTPPALHIGLIGPALSADLTLLHRLGQRHVLTLAAAPQNLWACEVMQSIQVVVLESGSVRGDVSQTVAALRQRHPHLQVVLVNGGIDQLHLADAFRAGATDYFATPWNVDLLAERIEVLAARATHDTDAVSGETL